MKILYWGDSPLAATSYGILASHILPAFIKDGHQVDAIGLRGIACMPPPDYPMRLLPVSPFNGSDPWGLNVLFKTLDTNSYDLVFTIGDVEAFPVLAKALGQARQKPRHVVGYVPIDGELLPATASLFKLPGLSLFAATNFGEAFMKKMNLPVRGIIPHGVDTETFFPMPNRPMRSELGLDLDEHLVVCIATNTAKKNLGGSIAAFAELCRLLPEKKLRLYLHTIMVSDDGGHLGLAADHFSFKEKQIVVCGKHPPMNYSDDEVAKIIASADLLLSTSLCEGWSMPMTEAFACKTPVVAPDHTAFSEIGAGRAFLYETRGTAWVGQYGRYLPVIDPLIAAAAMAKVLTSPEPEKTKKAHDFARSLDWPRVAGLWQIALRAFAPS